MEIELEEEGPGGLAMMPGGQGFGEQLGQQLRDALGKLGRKTKRRKAFPALRRFLIPGAATKAAIQRHQVT